MEQHATVRSRKKLQKVYVLMAASTRAKLKALAGVKGMRMFELLDTLVTDYVRGWEKLTKINLDNLQKADRLLSGKAKPAAKRKKS